MSALDIAAFAFYLVCWLGYEPLIKALGRRGGAINTDMTVIRRAWMVRMAGRENGIVDSQLLGHAINSASFFASSNLILIAATASAALGGTEPLRNLQGLGLIHAARWLFELRLAVVLVALARGLLDFIWSIRQLNYCLAAVGAAPRDGVGPEAEVYGQAAVGLLNPALSAFNAGVRGYYFALAAAAWLFGPIALALATAGAASLLIWRQRHSPASAAVRRLRALLEEGQPALTPRPIGHDTPVPPTPQ